MLQLSSYTRIRQYLGNQVDEVLTASYNLQREINNWIVSVSKQIETYLNRNLEIASYTEYFDINYNQTEFFLQAYPATTLTSVYEDTTGLWDGTDESEITDCYFGVNNYSVHLPYTLSYRCKKGLRIIYTGGLASSGVRSVFAITPSGSFTTGYYVLGATSGAMGIVRVASTSSITIEVLSGIFEAEETITEYSDADFTTASGTTATLDSVTSRGIAEAYPDLVRTCEMQIRYNYKHKHDFELTGTNRDGTNTRRQPDIAWNAPLQEEVMHILLPYRNVTL